MQCLIRLPTIATRPSTQATSNIVATDKNISLAMGFGMKYSYPCSGTIVANGFLGAKISDEIDLGVIAMTATVHCPSAIKVRVCDAYFSKRFETNVFGIPSPEERSMMTHHIKSFCSSRI